MKFINVNGHKAYDHLTHNIPLGSIVETFLEHEYWDDLVLSSVPEFRKDGCQIGLKNVKATLIVVGHTRDCDGTPLYILSDFLARFQLSGMNEESLKVVGKTEIQTWEDFVRDILEKQ